MEELIAETKRDQQDRLFIGLTAEGSGFHGPGRKHTIDDMIARRLRTDWVIKDWPWGKIPNLTAEESLYVKERLGEQVIH
jgi:hypothetical protein